MKKIINKNKVIVIASFIALVTALTIGFSPINAQIKAPEKKTVTTVAPAVVPKNEIATTPLVIVGSPQSYLNKDVKFKATFDKFSGLGLDYKPALRTSQDYIGILVKRDDVKDHTIPLSELKMFLKRSEAEKHIDLNSGDIVEIHGKVFSNALGDPWLDVTQFIVLTPKEKKISAK